MLNMFPCSVDAEQSCIADVFESQVLNLTRVIVNEYVNIRCYAMGKNCTDKLRSRNIRCNSNENILFELSSL